MNAVKHIIHHQYQTTNFNCSQTALSMLLSFYGKDIPPEEIMKSIPVAKDEKGQNWGTANQHLATWCLLQGFQVSMYTFDCQIIDLSWSKLKPDEMIKRLEVATLKRDVPSLGSYSKLYVQSYIDFLKAGGILDIKSHVTSQLLYDLLKTGPLLVSVCFNTLHNKGRQKIVGLRKTVSDDKEGHITTHSVVVYGNDENEKFLIADPWEEPGLHVIEPERLLCSITASQIECDNLLFQVRK